MVERFNVRNDGGMFEEEGGQYVDAEDYDKLRASFKRLQARLVEAGDEQYMCAEDELHGMACAFDDSLRISIEALKGGEN
jgi:hypothetical protein